MICTANTGAIKKFPTGVGTRQWWSGLSFNHFCSTPGKFPLASEAIDCVEAVLAVLAVLAYMNPTFPSFSYAFALSYSALGLSAVNNDIEP